MSNTTSASIGRQHGKADTDNNGLSRYILKIETPAGIKSGNEPDLSLQYSQGTPNGVVGFSWSIGGISSIGLGAPRIVYDRLNPPPEGYYDNSAPKLLMDGTDLLNTEGEYLGPGTKYTTEINNTGLEILSLGEGAGFLATDNMGRQVQYGTTEDSRVMSGDPAKPREWRIKVQSDCHGNTVTYHYKPSPALQSTKDVNTSYLTSIEYCGNSKTGAAASRVVHFDYEERPDLILQSANGVIVTWAHRLKKISIGVVESAHTTLSRFYTLEYIQSPITGDSCLQQVTESTYHSGQTTSLLPSAFTYQGPGVEKESLFEAVPQTVFSEEANTRALIPLNMTGRSLADMACMVWDDDKKTMTAKTFIAERNSSDSTVEWKPSEHDVSAVLPKWDPNQEGVVMPDFLTPDLRGDGRSDLIIPYQGTEDRLEFFLAQSNGLGLTATAAVKKTDFPWAPKSKFMAMDMTGTGVVDVVQIFVNGANLAFRTFPGIANDDAGYLGLGDAHQTDTNVAFDNTIDWFLLRHTGTGAVSLVRVWQKFLDNDPEQFSIWTSSFRCSKIFDSSGGFNSQSEDSEIAGPFPKDANEPAWSVMSSDINGDGTQDIVLGKAKWDADKMNFTFHVALGDGLGKFLPGKSCIVSAPAGKPNGGGPASFSVTNIHGGLYPSLAYVYQNESDGNFVCLSVGGRADGTVSEVTSFPLASKPGFDVTAIMPIDLNGTGMGAFMLYGLDKTTAKPSVVTVYNHSNPTDLLSTAQDSMGLTTTLTYAPLSQPGVYNSTIDWRQYTNPDPGSYYIIQGAPNHVVTGLQHSNNPAVNCLGFDVKINKTYSKALVNTCGRGWLGFESIMTENVKDEILTIEHFCQKFPLLGLKGRIDTFASGTTDFSNPLSSQTTDFDSVQKKASSGWSLYHINKRYDRLETGGAAGRVQLTEFSSDDDGNVLVKHSLETQAGKDVFWYWEHCNYTSISIPAGAAPRRLTGLLTYKKLTRIEANVNAAVFEPGDTALSCYTYKKGTGSMEKESHWNDDLTHNGFVTTEYTYDDYGNEVSRLDPADLTTITTYDTLFHNLAVQQEERGLGVLHTQFAAYDKATGEVVARQETSGKLTCVKVDGFGRKLDTRMRCVHPGSQSKKASLFLQTGLFVATVGFQKFLDDDETVLDPFETYAYMTFQSNDKQYVGAEVVSLFNEKQSGRRQVLDLVDCVGHRRIERATHGLDPTTQPQSDSKFSFKYWQYDTRGNTTFESFPIPVPVWTDFEYTPPATDGVTSVYDHLGRLVSTARTCHNNKTDMVFTNTQFTQGGAWVEQMVKGPNPNVNLKDVVLLTSPRKYISINGEEHVFTSTNQGNLDSEFQYDATGNCVQSTDPAGNIETRKYNSLGQLSTVANSYPDEIDTTGQLPSHKAIEYLYDSSGRLEKTVNAAGEIIVYQRDSKGRPLTKTGSDGRVLVYKYDGGGHESLTSMTVYPQGTEKPFETKLEFVYDVLGRLKSRKLSLAVGGTHETSFTYDWQGQVVTKTYPNNARKEYEYFGNRLSYARLTYQPAEGKLQVWLDSRLSYNDATGKPTEIVIGEASMHSTFKHSLVYDMQAFPQSHHLDRIEAATGQPSDHLVHEEYLYDGASRLASRTDSIAKLSSTYNYNGQRLESSQTGQEASKYAYDQAGNLTTKAGVAITYTKDSAHGTSGAGTVFNIKYDAAKRMISRNTSDASLTFQYDSFGLVASYQDAILQKTTITSGPDGKTVMRTRSGSDDSLLLVSDDYHVQKTANGPTTTTLKLAVSGVLLATYSLTEPGQSADDGGDAPGDAAAPSPKSSAAVLYTDNKGSVTHTFSGADGGALDVIAYDDFGSPAFNTVQSRDTGESARTGTYEAKSFDALSGLLDFGSRWYDPLVGRFTAPDHVLDVKYMSRTDGLNRLAFENNDPVNHTDPTGHWSLSAILGAAIGAVAVVAAIAVTVATAGAASPLVAIAAGAASGALASGGVAGISFSFDHKNERGGKFWGGYAATVLVNAAIGAATGALGAVATPARLVSATGRLASAAPWPVNSATVNLVGRAATVGSKALIGATHSLLTTVAHNAIENRLYGSRHGLLDGAGMAVGIGFGIGFVSGGLSARSIHSESGLMYVRNSSRAMTRATRAGPIALKGAWAAVHGGGVDSKGMRAARQAGHEASEELRDLQTHFKALTTMLGHSGLVGTLHAELSRNYVYVNSG